MAFPLTTVPLCEKDSKTKLPLSSSSSHLSTFGEFGVHVFLHFACQYCGARNDTHILDVITYGNTSTPK